MSPSWWPAPWADREVYETLAAVSSVWRLLAGATFLFLLVARWRRLARLERRTLAPVLAAAVFVAVIAAVPVEPRCTPRRAR